jgi:hypothetical protein
MERLLSEKDSKNTKRAISTSAKCFRNYLQANGIDQKFESFETGVLDSRLKEKYASVRKADGEHLKKSALYTLRYVLNRYLNDSVNVDISDSRTLPDSNKMFHAVLEDLKKKGFGKVDHMPPITKEDLTKLYSGSTRVIYVKSSTGLLNKVWFELMLHLCRRDQDNLRGMSKSTFDIVSQGGR